jgi:DNA-binding NarL/FixJ family response regulator
LPALLDNPDWVAAPALLANTARLAARTGRPADALRLVAAQRHLTQEIGARLRDVTEIERAAGAELRGRTEVQKYESEGARLSLADALALARAVIEEPTRRPDGRLSPRELEVVVLIGQGLSDRDIAAKLHRSVRTVEDHSRNARLKLNLRSRVELATWAAEHSLLD